MKEKVQTFCLSILGKPVTKKRARVGVGISKKTNKSYRWATTPDDWYEDMIRDAFLQNYPFPKYKPIGWSYCEDNDNPEEYAWELRKGILDKNLPKIEMDMIFYFRGGKIGDADNYVKSVKDALNDYAYIDDKQVKHERPYIVLLDEYDDLLESDENRFQDYATLERVDILIRPFDLMKDKFFLQLRNKFEKENKITDLLYDYYHPYRDMKKGELEAEANGVGLDCKGMVKDEIVKMLIAYDKKEGVSYFD